MLALSSARLAALVLLPMTMADRAGEPNGLAQTPPMGFNPYNHMKCAARRRRRRRRRQF